MYYVRRNVYLDLLSSTYTLHTARSRHCWTKTRFWEPISLLYLHVPNFHKIRTVISSVKSTRVWLSKHVSLTHTTTSGVLDPLLSCSPWWLYTLSISPPDLSNVGLSALWNSVSRYLYLFYLQIFLPIFWSIQCEFLLTGGWPWYYVSSVPSPHWSLPKFLSSL